MPEAVVKPVVDNAFRRLPRRWENVESLEASDLGADFDNRSSQVAKKNSRYMSKHSKGMK